MMTKTLFLLILSFSVFAAPTTTNTTFSEPGAKLKNGYGNFVFQQEVTITTNNFKVENFWDKFHQDGEQQSNYTNVSKAGMIEVSIESSSICTLHPELDKKGCSGQKPFLINDESLVGVSAGDTISLLFQKDYDLSSDTILYTDTNATVFYPLDIDRNEKYYKESVDSGPKSFFSFFQSMFNTFFGDSGFFGSFFNFGVIDNNSASAEDIRQRYIANIVSGVDQDHLLESNVTQISQDMSGYLLNTPVSLIDYTEDISSGGTCNFFFFPLPPDSSFCSLMSGMPFIGMFVSSTPTTNYVVDTIQADTEDALISFASKYADITLAEYQTGTVYQKQSESTGLITGMIDMMKCMFFGCSEVNNVDEPMDSYYAFTDNNALNLTFAVTDDGTQIDDFETFKLMGIHSLSGTQRSCTVKESNWNDKWSEHTFKLGDSDSVTTTEIVTIIDEPAVTCGWFDFGCEEVPAVTHEEEVTTTTYNTYSAKYMSETVQSNLNIDQDIADDELTSSEWLTWCDYMVDKYKDNVTKVCDGFMFFGICMGTIIEVPAGVEEDGYEILNYANESKRGLILDLKLIDEPDINNNANTIRYKTMNIK